VLTEPPLQQSLWFRTAEPAAAFPTLDGDHAADVAVVGGGFTGCSAALHLAAAGADAALVEAEEIGWGASGRNVGYVNAGLWLDPDEVERRAGREHGARLVAELGQAPELVYRLIEDHRIRCELTRKGVIKAAHSTRAVRALQDHIAQWRARGVEIEWLDRDRLAAATGTAIYRGGLLDHRSATINPLGYVRGLARAAAAASARLFIRSRVLRLERERGAWRVACANGSVRARAIILATDAYADSLWPGLRESFVPVGCFCYATRPLSEPERRRVLPAGHALYDTRAVMIFARLDSASRLIIGSLGYLPSGAPADARSWANRALRKLYPDLGEIGWESGWAGTIGFTPDHLPRWHEPAENLFIALGYNGRGIAPGTYMGRALAERALGTANAMPLLPVTPVTRLPFRDLRARAYELAFRLPRRMLL
jgi:glycine/D-amino acid oxidase-like deaminating enzyme